MSDSENEAQSSDVLVKAKTQNDSSGETSDQDKSSKSRGNGASDNGKSGLSKQQYDYEVKKLEPDSRGWYTIRFPKPDEAYTPEEAQEEFSKYGTITEAHFTAKFIYIRFPDKKSAKNALKNHTSKRDVEVPTVSKTWKGKENHGQDKGPQLYVGNISPHASKTEVKSLFIPYNMKDFKFYKIASKTFAFVYVHTPGDAKKAIKEVNGRKIRDTTLTVTMSNENTRTRALAGEEEVRKGDIELYIANFKWGTTLFEIRQLLEPFGFKTVRMESRSEGECNKAFAVMWSFESAIQAISQLNQMTWYGQRIFVTLWNREEQRPYRSDELEKIQLAEMSSRKMNYSIDRAVVLSQRLDAMIDDVIDECYYCSRVRNMMTELAEVLEQVQYIHHQSTGEYSPQQQYHGYGSGTGSKNSMKNQQSGASNSGIPSLLGPAPFNMGHGKMGHSGGSSLMGNYGDAMNFGFSGGQGGSMFGRKNEMYGNGSMSGNTGHHGGKGKRGRGKTH